MQSIKIYTIISLFIVFLSLFIPKNIDIAMAVAVGITLIIVEVLELTINFKKARGK